MELINVSIGELWDKYSILLIKKDKIKDLNKIESVNKELKFLDKNMSKYSFSDNKIFHNLKQINEKLWDIEDKIRIKELNKVFDNEFISLARSVYIINDKRAEAKKEINNIYNSEIYEVKEYQTYT